MLKREVKSTGDGSSTLYIPEWNESYHSKHGAIQEAVHVFIENGWKHFNNQSEIKVLEYGFGTGLNALLTLIYSEQEKKKTIFHSIEKFPITDFEISNLNIAQQLSNYLQIENSGIVNEFYNQMHKMDWNIEVEISDYFILKKINADFKTVEADSNFYNVIFYDAFGMRVQPELWTEDVFDKAYDFLKTNGLFTTYACNGNTKRALKNVGFFIEKKPGPPGKREMINAWKK